MLYYYYLYEEIGIKTTDISNEIVVNSDPNP